MRKNIVQSGDLVNEGGRIIADDWFEAAIPSNVQIGRDVYIDSSYGFAGCHTRIRNGVKVGDSTGMYDRTTFALGTAAKMKIGKYCILNGCNFVCNQEINVGDYCMISWGTYITDTWLLDETITLKEREESLVNISLSDFRNNNPFCGKTAPVTIKNGAWIGFGSVILPGVTIGENAVVGCQSVVNFSIPPHCVAAGNPARIVRYLRH